MLEAAFLTQDALNSSTLEAACVDCDVTRREISTTTVASLCWGRGKNGGWDRCRQSLQLLLLGWSGRHFFDLGIRFLLQLVDFGLLLGQKRSLEHFELDVVTFYCNHVDTRSQCPKDRPTGARSDDENRATNGNVMLAEVLGQLFRLLCGVDFVAVLILGEVGHMRQVDEVVALGRGDGVVHVTRLTAGEESDRGHLNRPHVIIGLCGCCVLSFVPEEVCHLLVAGVLQGFHDESRVFRLVPQYDGVGVVERILAHLSLLDDGCDLQNCYLVIPSFIEHIVGCVEFNAICQTNVSVQ